MKLWHPAALARMIQLIADMAHSGAQIAEILTAEFGQYYSRNAVIGKSSRLGLTLGRKPTPVDVVSLRARWAQRERERRAKVLILLPAPEQPVLHADLPEDQSRDAVHLLDAKPNQCRYVLGDSTDMMFCGSPVRHGTSWCMRHWHCLYIQPLTRQQAVG